MAELLTDEERALLGQGTARSAARAARDRDVQRLLDKLSGPRTALELIRHHRALVLLGDPGSGKTTVLRHLALSFAAARLAAGDQPAVLPPELAWTGALPLPILVQLRRFAEGLDAAPADAGPLLRHIKVLLSGDQLDVLAQHLHARLDEGGVVVLLDGLDEIADARRRAWAVQAIALFQSRFPHSRVVVTSRIYAYREPCLLPPTFAVATLQPLPPAEQDAFIARWYRAALLQGGELAHAERGQVAEQRAGALAAALERRPRLREVAASPLLLTMIALLHYSGIGLPQQRAELYDRCIDQLLEQWEQRRADGEVAA